jgi:putative transcriptional regulator
VFHVKRETSPNAAAQISRRAVLSLIASVAPVSCIAPASATPDITHGPTTLAGQLLIATPVMGDPRFANTVILMVRHSKAGAMGITINRPTGQRPLVDLLRAIGQDPAGADGEIRIFAGGPVQPEIGFILHDAGYRRADTTDIDGRVAMTTNPEVLRDIGRHAGPHKYLVAFGYAGWGAHQLEDELALRAWVVAPEDPALVFDVDRDTVWQAAMAHADHRP